MKKKFLFILVLLLGIAKGAWATDYITDVMVIGGDKSKVNSYKAKYMAQNWNVIDYDLNKDAGGNYVFLLYKTGTNKEDAITDFLLFVTGSSSDVPYMNQLGHRYSRTPAADNGIDDLNSGAGGKFIYLFYTKEAFDDGRAITGLTVDNTKAGSVTENGGLTACDLNKGAGGKYIYLHADNTIADSYRYSERSWDGKKVVETTKTCDDFTLLTSNTTNNRTELSDGWYVVGKNVEFNKRINITGNVNIILATGKVLKANQGIFIKTDKTLKIYTQPDGSGGIHAHTKIGAGIGAEGGNVAGRLEIHGGLIDAESYDHAICAGIGGADHTNSGFQSITIYGGKVYAKGDDYSPGIGCGRDNKEENRGTILIYGGDITATGGDDGAGIGGAQDGKNGFINIYGGGVRAEGGKGAAGIGGGSYAKIGRPITIKGGTVFAQGNGQCCSGIGHGYQLTNRVSPEGTVIIENAYVTARSGKSGSAVKAANVYIRNATVIAEATPDNSGIHFENVTLGDNIRVDNAAASSRKSQIDKEKVRIMPCDHSKGDVIFTDNNDGTHTVSGCYYCLGETVPHDSYVNMGGVYVCSTCHADKPANVEITDVVLYTYNGSEWQGVNYPVAKNDEYTLPTHNDIPGYDFVGWVPIAGLPSGDDIEPDRGETLLYPGQQLIVTTYTRLAARYRRIGITLANDESNEAVLTENLTCMRNVTLADRTLWKDDTWNTLCLPFDVEDGDDSDNISFTGTPLEGATVKELDGDNSSFDNRTGTLTLTFKDAASIEAGKPYIVKCNPCLYIGSDEEWIAFSKSVNDDLESYEGKTVLLTADIDVYTMVGTEAHPFKGTFDGQGHTMNLMYLTDIEGQGVAPFRYISGATIRNVKTTGFVYGHNHCSGLVGFAWSGINAINNCEVNARILCFGTHCGGILGHGKASTTTITDCLFTGIFPDSYFSTGIIYGWGDNPGKHTIINCMANGTYDARGTNLLKTDGGTETIINCYKNTTSFDQGTYTTATGGDLVDLLGNGWEVRDGKAIPKMVSDVFEIVFKNVTIDDIAPTGIISSDGKVTFIGTYAPVEIGKEGTNNKLYLGADNNLYWPNAEMAIGCQRAYFQITSYLGDVNCDGFVTVTDVTMLVNHILGNTNDSFFIEYADVNCDGEVNVTDVTALVNLILGGNRITNVVINGADGLTFGDGATGPARARKY